MLKSNPRPNVMSTAAKTSGLPVYWKTSTSSRYRDAWSVGIFGSYVLAVWIGDFHNNSHQQFIGITTAAPLCFNIIDAIQAQTKNLQDLIHNQYKKLNLVKTEICEASGLLPTTSCPKIVET